MHDDDVLTKRKMAECSQFVIPFVTSCKTIHSFFLSPQSVQLSAESNLTFGNFNNSLHTIVIECPRKWITYTYSFFSYIYLFIVS